MVQFVAGGPDIPDEVLQAWEEDRLVFFCGAGISVYTELPDFRELAEGLMTLLKNPGKSAVAKEVFKQKRYDRVLGIVEDNLYPGVMRTKLIEELTSSFQGDLYVHTAIIELAKLQDGKGCRFITTNADRRFLETKLLEEQECHIAPRLGPPRPEEWWHPVFLHGLINEINDPSGKHLVFTSADFGKAYLRDGWAARFVVELFREFTVLFVGYSLEDPVMGYLVDALAAERSITPRGTGERFKQAYAFGGYSYSSKDCEEQKLKWESKGVKMIPFNTGRVKKRPNFKLINNTLKEWAEFKNRGYSGGASWAIRIGNGRYVPHNSDLGTLRWLLSKPDGSVAKAFAAASPPPHISWLAPLSENFEISGWDEKTNIFNFPSEVGGSFKSGGKLVSRRHDPALMKGLSPVSYHLACWLCKYLDKRELTDWVVEQGGILHPQFAGEIVKVQEEKPLPAPFDQFWELLVQESLAPAAWIFPDNCWLILLNATHKNLLTNQEAALLLRSLTPQYRFNKSNESAEAESLRNLVAVDIILTNDHFNFKNRILKVGQSPWPPLGPLADELTSLLALAVKMQLAVEKPGAPWEWVSIEPHEQNKFTKHWTILGELCRQSFEVLCEQDKKAARDLVTRWQFLSRQDGFEVFLRMVLYAFAHCKWVDIEEALVPLMKHEIIWGYKYKREVCRFLASRGGDLSDDQLNRLVTTIRNGPPREMLGQNLSEEDFHQQQGYMIGMRLGKLQNGGAILPEAEQRLAKGYLGACKPGTDDRDEFAVWMEKAGWVPPSTVEAVVDRHPDEIARYIKSRSGWDAGDALRDMLTRDKEKGRAVMKFLAAMEPYPEGMWNDGFGGLEEAATQKEGSAILGDLQDFLTDYPQVFIHGLDGVGRILRKWAESQPLPEPCAFWNLWDGAWEQTKQRPSPEGDQTRDLTWAINDPAGVLAEALLERLWKRDPKRHDKLPQDLNGRFESMAQGDMPSNLAARIVLVSRLWGLFGVDPDWAKERIIPHMDWDCADAYSMWEGFLWSSRINPDLLVPLKPHMLKALSHARTEEHFTNLFALFADILIECRDAFTHNEIQNALGGMSDAGLVQCVGHFCDRLMQTEHAGALWEHSLASIMEIYWPKDRSKNTTMVRSALQNMLLETQEQFPHAWRLLKKYGLLGHLDDNGILLLLIDKQKRYKLADKHPKELLEFLNAIITDETPRQALIYLNNVLKAIGQVEPTMEQNSDFIRLRDVTQVL